MRPIRIAAQLHPQHGTYRAIRAAAVRAEELGYDLALHVGPLLPAVRATRDGEHFECWSLLAAWAEATERIELGPLVACNSYRNPDLLADMARTVDHISDGRVDPGHGRRLVPPRLRGVRLPVRDDRSPPARAGGGHPAHRAAARGAQPAAGPADADAHRRHAGRKRTLRLVARHADAWHATFPDRPEELEPTVAALRHWCAVEGRDPADIEWGVGVEPDDLERFFAEDAETYMAMGFTQFTLGFDGPAWAVERGVDALAWRDRMNRDRVPDVAATVRA